MKKTLIICFVAVTFASQAQTKKTPVKKVKTVTKTVSKSESAFKNSVDSFSYALGLEGAAYYKSQGAKKINSDLVKKAFDDVYNGKKLLLTPEQSSMTIQSKLMEYMSNKNSIVKEEGKKFLAENKKRAGVIELPSGLQYCP